MFFWHKSYEYKSEQKRISAKDKLKEKYEFWQNTIKAKETILQIIDKGYMLSFIKTLSDAKFSNSKPTLTNSAFVQEAIEEMFFSGTI